LQKPSKVQWGVAIESSIAGAGLFLARKVLTLVMSLSEGNKDNGLLSAISSIQW